MAGLPLTDRERYILGECAKGRSLCFTQDGDDAFLSSHPREWLPDSDDEAIHRLRRDGLIASPADADHWTAAYSYDITPAGLSALSARDKGAGG